MPGLIGAISKTESVRSLSLMFAALEHFEWLKRVELASTKRIRVGAVVREHIASEVDVYYNDTTGTKVILYGYACDSNTRQALKAKEIQRYCDPAANQLSAIDGSYVVVLIEPTCIRLINDRLGSLPVYFRMDEKEFLFSPEAKGILASQSRIAFDLAGVSAFLATGYCLGTHSLFKSIQVMAPASEISINLPQWKLEETNYWTMRFQADPMLDSRRNAEEALWDSLEKSMECQTADAPKRMTLMLSGGWDSRGMLPLMESTGGKFSGATSWGHLDNVRNSDVAIAREIARQYDVPFEFKKYGTDSFIENAEDWCRISELMNDNFGWYAEGPGTLENDYDRTADCLFVGDEVWGWGTDVSTEHEIRAAVIPPHFPSSITRLLSPSVVEECRLSYDASIAQIMSRCDDELPNDRKDFLYLYGRVARFIFALGYYKELSTPIRRPFLGKKTLDVIQAMPAKHRIFKTAYRSMLKRYAPRIAKIPDANVSSLPDWGYDLRRKSHLRSFFESLLDTKRIAAGPLATFFEPEVIGTITKQELAKEIKPVPRRQSAVAAFARNTLTSTSVGRYLNKKLRPNAKQNSAANQFSVLRRIALLTLLAEQFNIESCG